jgi:beta-galactosidase
MKKRIICLAIALLSLLTTAMQAREILPFNEGWTFRKGPFAADRVLSSVDLFAPDETVLGGFSNPQWTKVSIPHTWNNMDMQTDKNNFYAGECYYRKRYTPDNTLKDKRIFLRFEGVASVADVYVNRVFAGKHEGGYSAFAVEISELLNYGEENEILVKADNSSRPDVIPINHTLFGVYGGMYRPVSLIITEKMNISVTDYASPGVYLTQKNVSPKSAGVNVKVKIENKFRTPKTIRLETVVYHANGTVNQKKETRIQVSTQGRQTFEQELIINKPHLWQGLEDPYLYKVVIRLIDEGQIVDEVVQPLGIRTFELKPGDGMYLNGKKVNMYGTCRHQDRWQYGSALTNEQHAEDLEIIREMGATTIRFAHYQQAEYIYSKCDSIGFMAWAEIPFVNRVGTKEAGNAKQQLTELIRQNYNHPSIYVWGLHNEVYIPGNYTAALTAELHDLAKSEDPGRYTVSVNGYGNAGHRVNMQADIQGINRYFGWYERKIQDLEPWIEGLEQNYPHCMMMLAEYGAEANIEQQREVTGDIGDCCGFANHYDEAFATRLHEMQWGYIAKHPYLLASYIWNSFDFATPLSSQGGTEARNMKGLVTFDRKVKKDPFYWYKANWSKEPVVYLTQRRLTQRQQQQTTLTVYSNMGEPNLIVNNRPLNPPRQGITPVHYVYDDIELQTGENRIEAEVKYNGKSYKDSVTWYYSPDKQPENAPKNRVEKEKEHRGL